MKFKVVPAPRPRSFLRDAQQTLPLVPSSENDCCALLMADTDINSRDTAREWITFLQALGLVAESDGKYYRCRDRSANDIETAFRERVYAVEEILRALDDEGNSLATAEVFERVQETVPAWERHRREDWVSVWRERVRRILEWAVIFDLAERGNDGYNT